LQKSVVARRSIFFKRKNFFYTYDRGVDDAGLFVGQTDKVARREASFLRWDADRELIEGWKRGLQSQRVSLGLLAERQKLLWSTRGGLVGNHDLRGLLDLNRDLDGFASCISVLCLLRGKKGIYRRVNGFHLGSVLRVEPWDVHRDRVDGLCADRKCGFEFVADDLLDNF